MELLHDFFVRNAGRGVCERLFYALAEPFIVAGLGLASFFLPSCKGLAGNRPLLAEKVLDEPVPLSGRQFAGFFEELSGGATHAEIVARFR